jgi:ATP-dependent Clp protease ATP-binding subunit ClpA
LRSSHPSSSKYESVGLVKLDLPQSIDNLVAYLTGQPTDSHNSQIITENPVIISGATLLIRQTEIDRIIQILMRREKRSVVIIGEPGIGKTSLVYGMAHLFAQFRNSENIKEESVSSYRRLCTKKIVEIDQFDLAAPPSITQQQKKSSLISKLLKESEKLDNLIVFMRDIHTLLDATDSSAGASYGSPSADMAQLRSALSKNQIQGIGTTDRVSFNKCVDHAPAWKRIFTTISVVQPTEELSAAIIEKKLEGYKKYYSLSYEKEALKASITVSSRYIATAPLPDKALDILELLFHMIDYNIFCNPPVSFL